MRAIWSGSLAFGLINIPIKLYSASKERALKFNLLDRHGLHPISYMRVRRGTHEEVAYEDIVKGYEYKKGDYVVLTDEDFKTAAPKETSTIDIVNFTEREEIDPEYFEKPYYIEPDKKSEKAYILLREAMKRAGMCAVARFVMRDKEHICAIMPHENILILHELRFEDELRPIKGIKAPGKGAYSKKELDVALSLINHLEKHFNAKDYEDKYAEKLEKFIKEKVKTASKKKKGSKKSKTAQPIKSEEVMGSANMKDLMSMLKKSLEKEKART
jgi:DNA end-binding protein Ku